MNCWQDVEQVRNLLPILKFIIINNRFYKYTRFDLLIGACTVMALLSSHKKLELLSILWYFSIFLETFAIFPQIHFTARARYVGSSLVFYVGMLTCYRAFHIVHWAYMFLMKGHVDNYYVAVAGSAQFLVYCGYFFWMIPLFKAQYSHLKSTDSQPSVFTIVANGTDDGARRNESLRSDWLLCCLSIYIIRLRTKLPFYFREKCVFIYQLFGHIFKTKK